MNLTRKAYICTDVDRIYVSVMYHYDDENVLQLYLSIKDSNEPMINEIQHDAVEILAGMAQNGNSEAVNALTDLARTPMIHPLLREQIRAIIGTPASAK